MLPKLLLINSVVALMLFAAMVLSTTMIRADEVDDLQRQIDELAKLKSLSENATKPLEQEVSGLEAKIKAAQNGIAAAKANAVQKAKDISQREVELAVQYKLIRLRMAEEYKILRQSQTPSLWLLFASSVGMRQQLSYHSSVQTQDKALMQSTTQNILGLEKDKKDLEEKQKTLAKLQAQLDDQADFFKGEIAKAKQYQKELSGKIAELSARQQSIIAARSGSFTTSVGDVPLSDDFNASIGFKSQAPGDSFAVFSFGGYTHRKGMSQYGAKARAEAGQSVEDILAAYYPGTQIKKDYGEMGSISVQGYGGMSFEDQYLQGIYEMPGSWHINALKAQAIAARTYAIKYTGNGSKSICTTEACQVFKNQKKGGDWEKAVNETKNWVLVDGSGSPVSTQYASTHGGYSFTSGWDTQDKNGGGEWSTKAWENLAKSPWFYKAWYRSGYFVSGNSCNRSHPWLSQEEFGDIINAWIVRKNPSGADTGRIIPVTIGGCGVGGSGGDPYSMAELRDWANKAGGAVTKVNSVSVSHSGEGQTSNVHLSTNRGDIDIPGGEFKTTFNLRAPGYLRIPQSGYTFFNIEYKQ